MQERIINILLVEEDEVDVMNVKQGFQKYQITNLLYLVGNGIKVLEMLPSQDEKTSIVPENRRLILMDAVFDALDD